MKPVNHVTSLLRAYAVKIAAEKSAAGEGAPDRLTVADGNGGVSTSKESIPSDVGEKEVKNGLPADGKPLMAAAAASSPDRMTVADGTGGVTAAKASVPKDPGEAEVKINQPTNAEVNKAANLSASAARIRQALLGTPAARPAAQPGAQTSAEKRAGNDDADPIQLSQDLLAKIASAVLSSEDGIRYTHDLLEKQAGEAAARQQIQEALEAAQIHDSVEVTKSAALRDAATNAETIYAQLKQSGVNDEIADGILKAAAVIQEEIGQLDHPLLKMAFAQGMDDAELMAAAEEAQGAEGAPPVDEALPMGGEELSEEEILAILQEMIASGEITEEDVMAALQATAGGAAAPGA